MMAIRIDGKLAILWNDFHCDVKPFMTFITMAPTVALNKSVHLIGHLSMGDKFMPPRLPWKSSI
jgi:hypothetical protein